MHLHRGNHREVAATENSNCYCTSGFGALSAVTTFYQGQEVPAEVAAKRKRDWEQKQRR